jgi:osmotically-inducible protein OsmY
MKSPFDTEQILADFAITSHILGALKTNPQIPVHQIEVTTNNGCVTLSGNLPWEFQKGVVSEVVKKMAGIKEINNQIGIHPSPTKISFWSFSAN